MFSKILNGFPNKHLRTENAKLAAENERLNSRVKNSGAANQFGMGSQCDQSVGLNAFYDQPFTLNEQLNQSERLYYSDWQSQKIVEIVVDDMLREGWTYEGVDGAIIESICEHSVRLNLSKVLREALRLERLHGGCVIFMGLKDGEDDPSQPINFNLLTTDSLAFLNVVERRRISKVTYDNQPLSPNYGRPELYFVGGDAVHRSRLLIFDGDPLLPVRTGAVAANINNKNDGFGYPILIRLYNDLMFATGSRRAAFHLIQRASTLVFAGDLQSMSESVQGNDSLSQLKGMMSCINNYQAAILNSHPGQEATLSTLSASFGSVPELLMSYLQVLSAASDIPATRFLGQAPGGLNATGASDLENYYNTINARQRHRLEPNIRKLLNIMLFSIFGNNESLDQIEIVFTPLWNLSEVAEAQVRQIDTANITTLSSQGIITDEEALEEAKARGVFITDPTEVGIAREDDEEDVEDPSDLIEKLLGDTNDQSEGNQEATEEKR